mmetsp:Transcript_90957/g.257599  ORF Transcript_90957/g.257599 Transcript_90957/m.257599 type:complete len:406 (-) Transcript_90957:128-1345(-)
MRNEPADDRPDNARVPVLLGSEEPRLELQLLLGAVVVPEDRRGRQPVRKIHAVGPLDIPGGGHAVAAAVAALLGVAAVRAVGRHVVVVPAVDVREEYVDPPAEPGARAGPAGAPALAHGVPELLVGPAVAAAPGVLLPELVEKGQQRRAPFFREARLAALLDQRLRTSPQQLPVFSRALHHDPREAAHGRALEGEKTLRHVHHRDLQSNLLILARVCERRRQLLGDAIDKAAVDLLGEAIRLTIDHRRPVVLSPEAELVAPDVQLLLPLVGHPLRAQFLGMPPNVHGRGLQDHEPEVLGPHGQWVVRCEGRGGCCDEAVRMDAAQHNCVLRKIEDATLIHQTLRGFFLCQGRHAPPQRLGRETRLGHRKLRSHVEGRTWPPFVQRLEVMSCAHFGLQRHANRCCQ